MRERGRKSVFVELLMDLVHSLVSYTAQQWGKERVMPQLYNCPDLGASPLNCELLAGMCMHAHTHTHTNTVS